MGNKKIKDELTRIVKNSQSFIDRVSLATISVRRWIYDSRESSHKVIANITPISDNTISHLKESNVLLKLSSGKYFISYHKIMEPNYFDDSLDNRRDYCSVYVDTFLIGKINNCL